jgi:hypothetical protein
MDDPGFEFRKRQEIFFFFKMSTLAMWAHQASCSMDTVVFPGGKTA